MRSQLALAALVAAAALLPAQETSTQRLDFPSGGVLRMVHSNGELTVTGWDRPEIEITTIKAIRSEDDKKMLDRVSIKSENNGNAVAVTTTVPKNFVLLRPVEGITRVAIEYRISLPRAAKLEIDHESGEVHLEGIAGDIRVTDGQGLVTVRLPEQAAPEIDARSKLGAIDSDFPGNERKKLKFGHAFVEPGSSGAQKIYLRVGFGDIGIIKDSIPQVPSTAGVK